MATKPSPQKSKYGIETLDALGDKFKIGYSTVTGNFQTKLGGYLTILMGVLSTSMFFIVMSQFFYNDSPIVMNSSEFGSNENTYNLYKESLYPVIGLTVGISGVTADKFSRFITVKATVYTVVFRSDNASISSFDWQPFREFDFVPCGLIKDPHIRSYVSQIVDQKGFEWLVLCPDFKGQEKDFVVYENYDLDQYRWVNIRVYPCSLPDPRQCATAREIDAMRADYGYPFKLLEPSDRKNPMRSAPIRKVTHVDRRSTKVLRQLVTHNKVLDDTITTLIPPKVKIEYSTMEEETADFKVRDHTQIHCTKEEVALGPRGPCSEYLQFEYVASKEVVVTRRSYKMLTTMLGEFGGLLKIMTSMVFFFYGLYSMRKVKGFLGEIIFGKNQKSKKLLNKLVEVENNDSSSINNRDIAKVIVGEEKNEKSMDFSEKGKKQHNLDEIVQSLVKTRSSVENLMEKLNLLEVIEEAVFTESEKTLIPLALLKKEQKKINNNQVEKSEENHKNNSKTSKNAIFTKDSSQKESKDPFKEAFVNLMRTEPTTPFSHAIKNYLVSQLKETFVAAGGVPRQIEPNNVDVKRMKIPGNQKSQSTKIELIMPAQGSELGNPSPESTQQPEVASSRSFQKFMRPTNSPHIIGRGKFSLIKKRESSKRDSNISSFAQQNQKK